MLLQCVTWLPAVGGGAFMLQGCSVLQRRACRKWARLGDLLQKHVSEPKSNKHGGHMPIESQFPVLGQRDSY